VTKKKDNLVGPINIYLDFADFFFTCCISFLAY